MRARQVNLVSEIIHRKLQINSKISLEFTQKCSGYTALAIASASGTKTKEIDTGIADRERNMILFTEEALKFLAVTLQDDNDRSNL